MNQIENDFIEFLAQRNGEPVDSVRRRYLAAKEYMNFGSKEYSRHEDENYYTLQMFFNDQNDKNLFESYRYYAYPDILRMLSYSFPAIPTRKGYFKTFIRALKKGDLTKITSYLKRKTTQDPKISTADKLLNGYESPTILDYGCGLGHLSFEMAQKSPLSKIILVDLDTVKLDFTEYRFKKHGIKFEVLRIKEGNQYPTLPPHTICIATDVLEHLHKPLLAYGHIHDSMEEGGLLYGNFEDHHHGMYHTHPDMSDIREAIAKDYDVLGEGFYRKR